MSGLSVRSSPAVRGSEALPRVLCVDDDRDLREGVRDVLHCSYDVCVARNGDEALSILRHDQRRFAIVISDMRMPGMSGAEFLREARRLAPDTVRMLLTGHADLHTAIKAVNDGQLFRFHKAVQG